MMFRCLALFRHIYVRTIIITCSNKEATMRASITDLPVTIEADGYTLHETTWGVMHVVTLQKGDLSRAGELRR